MRLRVADILRSGVDEFLAGRILPTVVYKVIRALLTCRTRTLGGHAGLCKAGHISIWFNACRNRCCPSCAYARVQRWLERQVRILLGSAHHHVIFTVPHELNELWQLNQAVLGDLLFASAWDALRTLALDRRYLGALPGALMALHTWGQQLTLHPHIHCLVTAGGADGGGRWRACRRKHFLPAEPLKQLFRRRFLDGLCRLVRRGEVRLRSDWSLMQFEQLVRELEHKRWNIHVRERYPSPTAVLNYLGRYLNGGPFGESRLVGFDGARVSFRYKDYRVGDEKVMALPTVEFIRRYLQHVPPAGFHMVRGYGLYRRGSQNNHLRDRAAEQVPLTPEVRAELEANLPLAGPPIAGKTRCLTCGEPVVVVAPLRHRPPGLHPVAA